MQHSAGVNAAHTFLEPLVEDVPHGGLRLAGRIHLGIVKEVDAVLERRGHALVRHLPRMSRAMIACIA